MFFINVCLVALFHRMGTYFYSLFVHGSRTTYMKRGQNNPSVEMKRSSLKCNDYQQKKVVNVIEIFEVFEGGRLRV